MRVVIRYGNNKCGLKFYTHSAKGKSVFWPAPTKNSDTLSSLIIIYQVHYTMKSSTKRDPKKERERDAYLKHCVLVLYSKNQIKTTIKYHGFMVQFRH